MIIYRKRPADPDFTVFATLSGTIQPLYDVGGALYIMHLQAYFRAHLCEVSDNIIKKLEFSTRDVAAAFESETSLLVSDERVTITPSSGSGGISKGRLINNA